MAKIESVNELWHKHKKNEVEDFIKEKLNTLGSNISELEEEVGNIITNGTDGNKSLSLTDNDGNCIMQVAEGHVKTKSFDSRNAASKEYVNTKISENNKINVTKEQNDIVEISDKNDNIVFRIENGHLKSKYFDSRKVNEGVSSIGIEDLVLNGSAYRNGNTIVTRGGFANRVNLPEIVCYHYSMSVKFSCTNGVNMRIGKCSNNENSVYRGFVEIDGNSNVCKFCSEGSSIESYALGFILNENEDYTIRFSIDVALSCSYKIEVIGEENEYFYKEIVPANGEKYPFYYYPFVCSSANCTIKNFNLGINNYYDTRNLKVVVFGSSAVECDTLHGKRELGWAGRLASAIGEDKVANFGRGGATISSCLDTINGYAKLIKNAQYAIIYIGGINDTTIEPSISLNDIKERFESIADELLKYNIEPIFCTIKPVETGITSSVFNLANEWIRSADFKYKYIDMNKVFFKKDGSIDTSLFASEPPFYHDGTHVNMTGNLYLFNRVKMDCPFLF